MISRRNKLLETLVTGRHEESAQLLNNVVRMKDNDRSYRVVDLNWAEGTVVMADQQSGELVSMAANDFISSTLY